MKTPKVVGALAVLGFVTLALQGCGPTVAQGRSQQMLLKNAEILEEQKSCLRPVVENPSLAPLAQHINVPDGSAPTFTQKMNTAKPTRQEIALLISRFQLTEPCKERFTQRVASEVHPALAAVYNEAVMESDGVVLALVQGRVSWGEANQEWAKLKLTLENKNRAVWNAINSQLTVSHNIEMGNRAALVGAIIDAGATAAARRGR